MSATAIMRSLARAAQMAVSRRRGLGRRGAVAIMFALSAIPMAIAAGVPVDFSRIIAARSALQWAADNAALAGAAYVLYTQTDSFVRPPTPSLPASPAASWSPSRPRPR